MTEAEWNASVDPSAMLAWLTSGRTPAGSVAPDGSTAMNAPFTRPSDRRLRLFACACCRLCWPLLADARSRAAVETAERFADGLATEKELSAAHWEAHLGIVAPERQRRYPHADLAMRCSWAEEWLSGPGIDGRNNLVAFVEECPLPGLAQAALLREVVGSPFRPPELHRVYRRDAQGIMRETKCLNPAWITPTVTALALAAYGEPRVTGKCGRCGGDGKVYGKNIYQAGSHACPDCSGTGTTTDGLLDADRLGVLADALEDAGCTDAAVLGHLRGACRWCHGRGKVSARSATGDVLVDCLHCAGGVPEPGPHARGCWVLDLLLGKE